jgi:hypothetical protein
MLSMANPKNGQVPKVQRGGEGVFLQLSNDGLMLKAFESYRLGVVSTAMCLQNESADYRTGFSNEGLRKDRISSARACTSA